MGDKQHPHLVTFTDKQKLGRNQPIQTEEGGELYEIYMILVFQSHCVSSIPFYC